MLPPNRETEGLKGTLTDRSGAITTGGTVQDVAAVNATRHYFMFQNISDTVMYLDFGRDPTSNDSYQIAASGGAYVFDGNFIPVQVARVLCATTGKKFVAKEG